MSWTDENVETLKSLWAQGLSAGQIEGRMRGFSRSAIIGKVHRLGLAPRTTAVRKRPSPRNGLRFGDLSTKKLSPSAGASAKRRSPPQLTMSALQQQIAAGVTFVDIPEPSPSNVDPSRQHIASEAWNETCCKWPIGDPQRRDFHFCGAERVAGLPYCAAHVARAYQRIAIPAPVAGEASVSRVVEPA